MLKPIHAIWLIPFQWFSFWLSNSFHIPLFIDHAFLTLLAFSLREKKWVFVLFFVTSFTYGIFAKSLLFTLLSYQLLAGIFYFLLGYFSKKFSSMALALFVFNLLLNSLSSIHWQKTSSANWQEVLLSFFFFPLFDTLIGVLFIFIFLSFQRVSEKGSSSL